MYNSFISLGWFCGTAASMAKNGLRSFSGPFDWYFSELKGVLQTIETDFLDFLSDDNLDCVDDYPRQFMDTKYGFRFLHETKKDFRSDLPLIREKYERRICRFREIMHNGHVCFIRAVRNQKELSFIAENRQYIYSVIEKKALQNEIIYLIPQYLTVPTNFQEHYYILDIGKYCSGHDALRELFDAAGDFVSYCRANYSTDSYQTNMLFALQSEYQKRLPFMSRYERLHKLSNTDFSSLTFPDKLIVYGLGIVGKDLYEKIKEYTKVECFIDKAPKEDYYDNIPVVSISEYRHDQKTCIIVTPSYEYYKICIELKNACNIPLSQMIMLEDFLKCGII